MLSMFNKVSYINLFGKLLFRSIIFSAVYVFCSTYLTTHVRNYCYYSIYS